MGERPSGLGASRAEEKGASRLARAGVLEQYRQRNEVLAVTYAVRIIQTGNIGHVLPADTLNCPKASLGPSQPSFTSEALTLSRQSRHVCWVKAAVVNARHLSRVPGRKSVKRASYPGASGGLRAIVAGEREPAQLAALRDRRCKHSEAGRISAGIGARTVRGHQTDPAARRAGQGCAPLRVLVAAGPAHGRVRATRVAGVLRMAAPLAYLYVASRFRLRPLRVRQVDLG